MLAEKQIVAQWLRQEGFFTIRPLYAKIARDLGFLAIKYHNGLIDKVRHVETICWISGIPEPRSIFNDVLKNRFANKSVNEVVQAEIVELGIKDFKVENVLVVGEFSQKDSAHQIAEKEGITLFHFSQILSRTLMGLDTHYDRDPAIKSLQLLRFILANEPAELIETLFGEQGIVSSSARKRFAMALLDAHVLDQEFSKTDIEQLRPLLSQKKVADVDALAKLIGETLLNRKTRKPFMEALAKYKVTKPLKKEITLNKFLSED